uniref:uncharacterized protein LOC122607954 n=1 Tax=Erigeron canadensis TaxID=72917 RepID=UPI001CB8DD67|nr:uncharacterized protein LOC122607954 [Erigeron canadensis]
MRLETTTNPTKVSSKNPIIEDYLVIHDFDYYKSRPYDLIQIRKAIFLEGLENGDNEIADFGKCSTFKEMKAWIVNAAFVANKRLVLERRKGEHRRLWGGRRSRLAFFTEKQQQMFREGWDQDA